jgi:arginyl-tRNA synthetase
MEDPKVKIYSILEKVAVELGVEASNFSVEKPKDASHGDFSSNIAMVLHKTIKAGLSHSIRDARHELAKPTKRGPAADLPPASAHSRLTDLRAVGSPSFGVTPDLVNPLDLAKEIVKQIGSSNSEFEKIEAVEPGFINFYLSPKYLQSQVQNIIEKGEEYGSSTLGKEKKASVEFVSANPTGPLHIGNARGGPLGDTLANVLSKAGYQVIREYLHNDVGGQVDRLGESIYFTIHPDQKAVDYEMQYQGEYIKELSTLVKEDLEEGQEDLSQEEFIERAGQVAVELMLTEILKDCEAMGIKFDKVRKESDLRKEVPQVLSKIKKALKEKDGAEWFAPADEFLKDRETVVKKSDGQFTYFASDIVYHNEKMTANDLVIDVLGANHSGHVPRLKAVVKSLGFNPDDLRVTLYQWVRLKRGEEVVKMSKRAGNFITAKEVLDEVGKDAFRFFLLTPRSQTHMDFDLELAKKKAADNPVFYVQYAYSRICSIFKKAPVLGSQADLSLLKTQEEVELIRHLLKLPYLIEEAVKSLEVNPLTTYALEIANLFHKFYEKQMVISKDAKLTQARLALLKATQITLKNTLALLGVSAPEHM